MRRASLLVEDFDAIPAVEGEAFAGCGCIRCRTEENLPLCRAEARAQGFRAGKAERNAADAAAAEALAGILKSAMQVADAAAGEIAEASAEALGRLVIAMMTACLPATYARLGVAEVRAVAAAVLPALKVEPAITIRAAPDALEALRAVPDHTPELLRPRLTLLPDATAAPGDVRIDWQAGSSRRNPREALAQVMSVLSEFGLAPSPGDEIMTERMEELAHG